MKRRTKRRRHALAFTLLELTVAMVLMTTAVGLATLGMQGLSDRGRIDAAAAQLGSALRLAEIQATRTGLPQVLAFDERGWTARQPEWRDEAWTWSESSRLELVGKVRIRRVARDGTANAPDVDGPWLITITPGVREVNVRFEVRLVNGLEAGIEIRPGGATSVRLFDEERSER